MVQLPESGPTWQAMRLSRNRNWGQPEMIEFLKELSVVATQVGWAGLYIGDISQPRGGPMTSGHASHQIGLDADVWMLPPRRLNLTAAEREKTQLDPGPFGRSAVGHGQLDARTQAFAANGGV